MSYILEALKKSQSERELGQVPRIEGFGVDVPLEVPRSRPWAYIGLLFGMAVLIGGVGLLVLRGLSEAPAQLATSTTPLALPAVEPVAARRAPAISDASPQTPPPPVEPTPPEPQPVASSVPPASPPAAPETPASRAPNDLAPRPPRLSDPTPGGFTRAGDTPSEPGTALELTDDANLSVEPQVLVVPAPAAPGEPQPRGAEELRRAVLGDTADQLSASVDSTRASLPRPPPPDQPLPRRSGPVDDRAPVPDDLIAEIEAFKDLVRKRDPEATRQARTGPPRLPDPPGLGLPPIKQVSERPPRPNLDLLNRLPPFSMTVHVYDPNPSRRFIYINGRKLTESQQTPDGLRLERVVDDGAVLSWQGEEFFQRR